MADVPSTWPDNYVELIDQQTPSHYEQKVWPEYGKLSFEIWGVVFDIKKNLITILDSQEVKEDSKRKREELKSEISWELVWEEKEQFILKLKELPDYEGSKVKKAVENQTIEIKKIPWRDWYAIYESKVWNLVYITRLDWTQYENIDKFRNKDLFWAMIIWGFVRQWFKIEKDVDIWRLYNKDWTEIPIYSDEYSTASLNAVNLMRSELRWWEKEDNRRLNWKKED